MSLNCPFILNDTGVEEVDIMVGFLELSIFLHFFNAISIPSMKVRNIVKRKYMCVKSLYFIEKRVNQYWSN